jgi:hypothetical protein
VTRAWRLRPAALMYRAQVKLRGAQDNQLDLLGGRYVHERPAEIAPLLGGALRQMPTVGSRQRTVADR